MTGFGAAEATTPQHRLKVEVKTLNSKFLDVSLKLPRELADKELEVKLLLNNHLKRGKVNMVVELTPLEVTEPMVHINEALFKSYYTRFTKMAEEVGANPKDLFRLALHAPDVITTDEAGADTEWPAVQNAIVQALDQCNEFRKQEGAALANKMRQYIESIRSLLEQVSQRDPERAAAIRERIGGNIDEIRERVQVDQNRFEQELIYYLEKLDITEEKVRLAQHLDYFLVVMNEDELQGKKLGFIAQEIGREINTIGSKANDAVIQRAVVQMKDELEKIKEQSMNIL